MYGLVDLIVKKTGRVQSAQNILGGLASRSGKKNQQG